MYCLCVACDERYENGFLPKITESLLFFFFSFVSPLFGDVEKALRRDGESTGERFAGNCDSVWKSLKKVGGEHEMVVRNSGQVILKAS
mmetsp:Transcript_12094/g.16094  ORF Transcript_12094/g.16094 Transcript_12094/m.16094 type:complete len:88 (+) Transcript_12094:362-625(+)